MLQVKVDPKSWTGPHAWCEPGDLPQISGHGKYHYTGLIDLPLLVTPAISGTFAVAIDHRTRIALKMHSLRTEFLRSFRLRQGHNSLQTSSLRKACTRSLLP